MSASTNLTDHDIRQISRITTAVLLDMMTEAGDIREEQAVDWCQRLVAPHASSLGEALDLMEAPAEMRLAVARSVARGDVSRGQIHARSVRALDFAADVLGDLRAVTVMAHEHGSVLVRVSPRLSPTLAAHPRAQVQARSDGLSDLCIYSEDGDACLCCALSQDEIRALGIVGVAA